MVVGLAMALISGQRHPEPVRLSRLLSDGTMADRVMGFGVLVLALTPVFRVGALVVIWAKERDRRFVVVASAVVVVLVAAFLLGEG